MHTLTRRARDYRATGRPVLAAATAAASVLNMIPKWLPALSPPGAGEHVTHTSPNIPSVVQCVRARREITYIVVYASARHIAHECMQSMSVINIG